MSGVDGAKRRVDVGWMAQVARLIRWLTAANPAERPSAREVLRSELLPPTVGDEQLTDLLRSLPDKSAAPHTMLASLLCTRVYRFQTHCILRA